MAPFVLIERTRLFALAVRDVCTALPHTDEAQEAARQLRRAADWLRYLRDTGIRHDAKLLQEGEELARIFAASIRTARTNSKKPPIARR